jgi:glucokinase
VSADRVIGVDLGGTKILVGVVDRAGKVLREHARPTPVESQDALLAALTTGVEELLDDDIAAIGLGVPSQVDQRKGRAYGSVNIPLHDLALRDLIRERFSLPTGLENDANAAAFAEWAFGAARSAHDMIMLTLGTGVGGGAVIDDRLYRGWAEFGHIVVEYDGKPCQGNCTGRGHLESYCTGVAATESARLALGPHADARVLLDAARQGDAAAIAVLDDIGGRLGAGVGSLVNIFDPEMVVIGGGFGIAAFELLVDAARRIVRREALAPAGENVKIVPAELGGDAGLIGAALVAFEALESG